MKNFFIATIAISAALLTAPGILPARAAEGTQDNTYSAEELVQAGSEFFEVGAGAMAMAVERVFAEHGRPNGYIIGEEGSGAIGVGLRYGDGTLRRKGSADLKVYWQGPSIGFDFGGNASKVFTLVYNLPNDQAMFQRFPGVDGSAYLVAGIGVNYQQAGGIILAPMRSGVGLRLGANVGYLSYTRERRLLPF
nr:MAG: DUF1134 domain-containing protein [Hyphomicrobiales bacterium]